MEKIVRLLWKQKLHTVIRLIRLNTNKTKKKDKTKAILYFLSFFFCFFCIKFVMTQDRIKLFRNNINAIMVELGKRQGILPITPNIFV